MVLKIIKFISIFYVVRKIVIKVVTKKLIKNI